MLGTLGLLLALGPQNAPAAPAAATVEVGSAAAAAGEGAAVAASVETHNHIVFTVGGAKLRDFTQDRVDRRSFDAVVVARTPEKTAIRVQYGVCTSSVADPAVNSEQAIKLSEQSYLVTRSGSPARIDVREIGPQDETSEVKEDVAAQVSRDVAELLDGGRWAKTLGGKPLAVGEAIAFSAEDARALLADVLPDLVVTRFELTPRPSGGDPERVAFGVVASATMKQGDDPAVSSTFELSGELHLGRAHGRLVALQLGGPLRFAGSKEQQGTKIEVVGTGTLAWTYRADPLPKK